MNHERFAVASDQCIYPCGFEPAALFWNLAAKEVLGHAEADEADCRFQQRGFNFLSPAGALPRGDRGQHTVTAVQTAQVIRKRRSRPFRLFEIGEYAQESAQGLTESVVTWFFAVRPMLAEGGNRAIDNAWIYFLDLFIADTQTVDDARAQILHDHVGAFGEPHEDLFPFRLLDIESDAFLVAVHTTEARAVVLRFLVPSAKGVSPSGSFDLVDIRAEIRQ